MLLKNLLRKLKSNALITEKYLYKIENILLVVGLTVMMTLGAGQVVLRNFFQTGVEWADMLVRALVLWLGFMGASVATRNVKHINIEILSKFVANPKLERFRQRLVYFISLVISSILLKASITYTIIEQSNHMVAFLNIPTWVVFIIVPISLLTISLRLLLQIFVTVEEN